MDRLNSCVHLYCLNPSANAFSRKHWRHKWKPYLLMWPPVRPQRTHFFVEAPGRSQVCDRNRKVKRIQCHCRSAGLPLLGDRIAIDIPDLDRRNFQRLDLAANLREVTHDEPDQAAGLDDLRLCL